jgi:hypothetical protein
LPDIIQDKIKRSLQAVDGAYHHLVLLVGESKSGKTGVLRSFANNFGVSVINVNLTVSTKLLELTPKQRILRLSEILNNLVGEPQSVIILDNIEILFDKDLQHDPLRLLQSISRNHSVVASWSGRVSQGNLIYAEKDHPEYRSYNVLDLIIVNMDGTTTIDFMQSTTTETEQV